MLLRDLLKTTANLHFSFRFVMFFGYISLLFDFFIIISNF